MEQIIFFIWMFSVLILVLLEVYFLEWKYHSETRDWNNENVHTDIVWTQYFIGSKFPFCLFSKINYSLN